MIWAGGVFTAPQLEGLAEDFNFAEHVKLWQVILARAYRSPQLASALARDLGIPIDDAARAVLQDVEAKSRQRFLSAYPAAERLKLTMRTQEGAAGPKRMMLFDLLNGKGELLFGMGFSWPAVPPEKYSEIK